jgi:tellurite resistance protein
MHDQDKAIIKSLVSVAWADGRFATEEEEVIEALLQAFGATREEADDIRTYAKVPRTLDDVPLTELSADDRRALLQHAVLLTFIDGHQAPEEKEMLTALCAKLRIGPEESATLLAAAEERAKRFISLL